MIAIRIVLSGFEFLVWSGICAGAGTAVAGVILGFGNRK